MGSASSKKQTVVRELSQIPQHTITENNGEQQRDIQYRQHSNNLQVQPASTIQVLETESANHRRKSTHSGVDVPEITDVSAQSTIEHQQRTIRAMTQRLKEQDAKIQELSNRLSSAISSKVRYNNPDIADLNDNNRPQKIGERFSEMYDNEWTNAYLDLKHIVSTERQIIDVLLDIVKVIYNKCVDISTKQITDLQEHLVRFTGNDSFTETLALSTKVYKDERKKNCGYFLPMIRKSLKETIVNESRFDTEDLQTYIHVAIELCWLMCIQEPRLYLDTGCLPGDIFDDSLYKPYTEKSKKIDFLVWPVLYLYRDGPLLSKGVAQGGILKRSHPSFKSTRKQHQGPTSQCVDSSQTRHSPDASPSIKTTEFTRTLNNTIESPRNVQLKGIGVSPHAAPYAGKTSVQSHSNDRQHVSGYTIPYNHSDAFLTGAVPKMIKPGQTINHKF